MDWNSFYGDMCDFIEENEDFYTVYTEYVNTEIYKEIVGFLDIARPDWRKHKGLGIYAPEFILSVINMWDSSEEEESVKEWLKTIYEDIDERYGSYSSTNAFNRDEIFRKEFEEEQGPYDAGWPGTEAEYEAEYEKYEEQRLEETYWPF